MVVVVMMCRLVVVAVCWLVGRKGGCGGYGGCAVDRL